MSRKIFCWRKVSTKPCRTARRKAVSLRCMNFRCLSAIDYSEIFLARAAASKTVSQKSPTAIALAPDPGKFSPASFSRPSMPRRRMLALSSALAAAIHSGTVQIEEFENLPFGSRFLYGFRHSVHDAGRVQAFAPRGFPADIPKPVISRNPDA